MFNSTTAHKLGRYYESSYVATATFNQIMTAMVSNYDVVAVFRFLPKYPVVDCPCSLGGSLNNIAWIIVVTATFCSLTAFTTSTGESLRFSTYYLFLLCLQPYWLWSSPLLAPFEKGKGHVSCPPTHWWRYACCKWCINTDISEYSLRAWLESQPRRRPLHWYGRRQGISLQFTDRTMVKFHLTAAQAGHRRFFIALGSYIAFGKPGSLDLLWWRVPYLHITIMKGPRTCRKG